jgi:aspartate/methionine/tyrosine aminotransferase
LPSWESLIPKGFFLSSLKRTQTFSVELASVYSCSKGYLGECGLRGGYIEFVNLDPKVFDQFKKMVTLKLRPNVLGQLVLDCLVNPPRQGDPSYELWAKEKAGVLNTLKERAEMASKAFNGIDGITCGVVNAAMYAFPQLNLSAKAVEKTKVCLFSYLKNYSSSQFLVSRHETQLLLCLPTFGRNWDLCCPWKRIWSTRRYSSFSVHYFAAT